MRPGLRRGRSQPVCQGAMDRLPPQRLTAMRTPPQPLQRVSEHVLQVDVTGENTLPGGGNESVPQSLDDGRVELPGIGRASVPEGVSQVALPQTVRIPARGLRGDLNGRRNGGRLGHAGMMAVDLERDKGRAILGLRPCPKNRGIPVLRPALGG